MAKGSKMARRREAATEHLDLEGRTPRGFEALARYSRRLVHRFKSSELPAPKVELEVDPTTLANDLEPSTTRLVALVSRLRDGGWSEQDAIHARNLSLAAFDADYVPITSLIESIYLLGGQLKLAKKLRPQRGRRLVNRHADFDPRPKAGLLAGSAPRLACFFRRLARRLGWGVTGDPPAMADKHPPRQR